MKVERDCKIVQDLLPNYIENLTNEETNEYVKEHLNKCSECNKIYENMKKEVDLKVAKKDNKEVKYLKKFNFKFKLLRNLLIIIVAIIIIIVARKSCILINLSNKQKELENSNNYYAKIESYSDGNMNIIETYVKDDKFLTTFNKYSKEDDVIKMVTYKSGDEQFRLLENKDKKVLYHDGIEMLKVQPISYLPNNFIQTLFMAINTSINKAEFDGKECYILRIDDSEVFVEAETGLMIKKIDNYNNTIDYEYEFGIVEDTDIVKPDTSGYIVNEE